jgi:uncharacterized membrane protein YhiD involved in acid resistance
MWVAAGIVPVLLELPGAVGFAIIAGIGFAGAGVYWVGLRQMAQGLDPLPLRHQVRDRLKRRR